MLKKFWSDEAGATMTEYAVLVAVVAMAIYLVVKMFGGKVREIFFNSTIVLDDANSSIGQ